VLKNLVAIGVLQVRVIKKNKQYKVNWELLRSRQVSVVNNPNQTGTSGITSAIFDENIPESPFDLIDYEDENSATIRDWYNHEISLDHVKNDFDLSDSGILESDKKEDQPQPPSDLIELDPLEVEIKQEFEKITGKPLNLKKNRKPLAELKEIATQAKDIVMLAFRNIANHIAETGTKVYNLGYVLTTVKNLMQPKATPKLTPRDYAPASEQDKAYGATGGDHAKYREQPSTETPEQKAERTKQESQAVHLLLKHEALRTEFFNALDEQDKNELIEMEIDYLKTRPIWEKLKPKWPWFDNSYAVTYVIDKIKDYLLQEFLYNQQDLATQPSG
jgi:hypothetical protein